MLQRERIFSLYNVPLSSTSGKGSAKSNNIHEIYVSIRSDWELYRNIYLLLVVLNI